VRLRETKHETDPSFLPYWPPRRQQTVTTHRENPKFVLPEERIATFDQQMLI